MPGVILPEYVRRNREVEKQEQVLDEHMRIAVEFTRELRKIDEHLDLILASERPTDPILADHPGCWHIKRANLGTANSYIAIATDDGRYREPVAEDLLRLRDRDLWRSEAINDLILERRLLGAAEDRAAALERAARKADFPQAVKAHDSPGVTFGDGPFRARAKGRRNV